MVTSSQPYRSGLCSRVNAWCACLRASPGQARAPRPRHSDDRSLQDVNHARPAQVVVNRAEDASRFDRHRMHPELAPRHTGDHGTEVDCRKQFDRNAFRVRCHPFVVHRRFTVSFDPMQGRHPPPRSAECPRAPPLAAAACPNAQATEGLVSDTIRAWRVRLVAVPMPGPVPMAGGHKAAIFPPRTELGAGAPSSRTGGS